MQIVINIPHNLYETTMKDYALSKLGEHVLYKAVQHGTPLPENHGRLIDADELKKIIKKNDVLTMTGFNVRFCDINNTPTIIPATKEGE